MQETEEKPNFKLRLSSLEFTLPRIRVSISTWISLIVLGIISVLSTAYFYQNNLIVAYNDARAHMNMARLVVDNLNPGLAQIGSVWLPLNHMLTLSLVWNDLLWKTGLAGAIFSMISYVFASLLIYKLIQKTMKNNSIAFLGMAVFATNLNLLYMQSTPMTELLLLLFFTSSTFFLYKWAVSQKINDLILLAGSVFLATLTRYDGWFLFLVISAAVIVIPFKKIARGKILLKNAKSFYNKRTYIEGNFVLFVSLASFGIFLWILWNLAIFKDPFYFATGPYSAHAQQVKIEAAGSLPTKHNLPLSVLAYWWATVDNVGFLLTIFSIIGLIIFAIKNKFSAKAIVAYTLLVPLLFHVISLYFGQSILIVPELGVNVTKEAKGSWFNVRYGLMMLPAVAFFSAYLASKDKVLKIILILLIFIQPIIFITTNNIITITDGVIGTSSLDVADVRDWLVANAKDDNGLILTSISFNNALAFSTGIPLKRFIHEGTGNYWSDSLKDPNRYAKWVVMANGDVGDPVYDSLIKKQNASFLNHYNLSMKAKHTNIYQRKELPAGLVVARGNQFFIDDSEFKFIGVNSYDLAYRTNEEIDQTISLAAKNGIKVIRFWAFGEGRKDGFQPEKGVYNTESFNRLSYAIASASKHNIKLIVVLSNYWSDYGGTLKYLDWQNLPHKKQSDSDLFFIDDGIKELFKSYTNKVLNYKSPYTNKLLKNETAIFSWELMNEPRVSSKAKGGIVIDWLNDMSSYIRTIDQNHLISSGTEGFSPIYDSSNGPYINEIASSSAEMVTAHFYQGKSVQSIDKVIEDWGKIARVNAFKPIIIEELGLDKRVKENNGRKREELLTELLKEVKKNEINGILLWNWALKTDNSFGISPLDTGDQELIKQIKSFSEELNKN